MNDDEKIKLILQALLESYNHTRTEIIAYQNNYYITLQIFIGGIFLLIAYMVRINSFEFTLMIPFIVLTLYLVMLYTYDIVTSLGGSALEIENKINKLLSVNEDEQIVNFEIKWRGLAITKGNFIKMMICSITLVFIVSLIPFAITFYLLNNEIDYRILYFYIVILLIGFYYTYKVIKKREKIYNDINGKLFILRQEK